MLDDTNIVVIAGMHRSGTSFFANLLMKSGLEIGERLLVAEDNPNGHFEDQTFLNFHKKVLNSRRLNISGLFMKAVPKGFTKQEIVLAKEIVVEKGLKSKSDLWGWKEPRTTLFLDDWKAVVPALKVVGVYRPVSEVVDSLKRRDRKAAVYPTRNFMKKIIWTFRFSKLNVWLTRRYIKQWVLYNQSLLSFIEKYPDDSILFALNEVVECPKVCIELINSRFGLGLLPTETKIFQKEYLHQFEKVSVRGSEIEKISKALQEYRYKNR